MAGVAAAADARIRLISTSGAGPRGAAVARNLGLKAAEGDFIAFLDADDLFEPDKLQFELATFEQHPEAAMVYGPTRWWYPGEPERDWTEDMRGVAGRLDPPPLLLSRIVLLQKGHVPCTCAVLIRRRALDAVGGFDEGFRLYEDQTLWVKIFAHFPVFVSDICLARYRQHAGSVSAQAERSGDYHQIRPHKARTAFLTWVAGYIAQVGSDECCPCTSASACAGPRRCASWPAAQFGPIGSLCRGDLSTPASTLAGQ